MTVHRFRDRISQALDDHVPAPLRPMIKGMEEPLLAFSLELLLETLETDCPDLLAQIDADPSRYPAIYGKLLHARNARTGDVEQSDDNARPSPTHGS